MKKILLRRWQNPAQPLYMALAFQGVIFVLVYVTERPHAASGLIGGTVGCILASLRMHRAVAQ